MRLAQIMASTLERYADRPALGERVRRLVHAPETGHASLKAAPEYRTITYRELWQRVQAVASEWRRNRDSPLRPGDRVVVLGFTSVEYTVVDLACIHLGAVSVPLQTSSSLRQQRAITEETRPAMIATSLDRMHVAVDLAREFPGVRRILVFDYHDGVQDQRETYLAEKERLRGSGTVCATFAEILTEGAAQEAAPLHVPEDEEALSMLIYTSGSTGSPKGAIYTDRLHAAMWGGEAWSNLFSDVHAVNINYMPMSHVAGHSSLKNTMARGGASYFTASSDLSTFFEDISLIQPTEVSLVPRVCEMLFQRYQHELDKRRGAGDDGPDLEARVKADMRENLLGGRVSWASSGSAPLSDELHAFVESLLGIGLHIIYGSTEAAGVMADGKLIRPPVTAFKLDDVPELGYFRTDRPHPRGELLLKTDSIVPGYYARPELTKTLFDEDGYYKTGDIVAEVEPERLEIVDRRKNVLKLSQGEFVATSHLEAVFAASPLVRQIFVYGNSHRSYLLAVVVPTPMALEEHPLDDGSLKAEIRRSFQEIAKEEGLNSYEIPRDLLVETEPFSQANGLLSDHRKLLRPQLLERYGGRLELMYTETESREANELRELRATGRERPVLETVLHAARVMLAGGSDDIGAGVNFRDIGGDSLSALTFVQLLEEVFEVAVPVDVVISPANDLAQVAEYIDGKRASGAKRPSAASVHGSAEGELNASDLRLEAFIEDPSDTSAPAAPRAQGRPTTVLLTGASGYLGRFLALEWLERLKPIGGKLVCIVRDRDAQAAWDRLEGSYAGGAGEALERFGALAAQNLEVVAGDLAEEQLGLDATTWNRLADEVDLIVHAGALVNHVLPYSGLFEANVVGTAELIRLGTTRRLKSFTYMSSVAVAVAPPEGEPLDEEADIRKALPVLRTDGDRYADGYTASKWAGEVLLREAHDAYGMPVTVFRSSMILAHSRYKGQMNVPDMFTRLLYSVLATRLAPRSFYSGSGSQAVPRAHYDGLPVDFTAGAVAGLSVRAEGGYRIYNLVNPHEDGVSLDTFVDWLDDAGYGITRVEGYTDWVERFESMLKSLPEQKRGYSVLPLIHGLKEPEAPLPGAPVPAHRFQDAVRVPGIGPAMEIPHISRDLIEKYADNLRELL
ncbi:carboxylic acid reductase [Streptomonospora litoralis]|uniref:Carboxylic acid reductase n=1 Tax=Streptomonospora litoralis TaxID=2498135 RepID=A0A4P6Q8L8_9ACTN|nr:carboxylic acid reductase [Streptomonospora litoralis]QBI55454.1 Carboxylic acid reductase [Streptomonospora litoralis]